MTQCRTMFHAPRDQASLKADLERFSEDWGVLLLLLILVLVVVLVLLLVLVVVVVVVVLLLLLDDEYGNPSHCVCIALYAHLHGSLFIRSLHSCTVYIVHIKYMMCYVSISMYRILMLCYMFIS